jgi:hypothetical protein
MEVAVSSEMLVPTYQLTRYRIPEELNLDSYALRISSVTSLHEINEQIIRATQCNNFTVHYHCQQ